MNLNVTDCEVLALDTGIINCPVTSDRLPVLFVTIRVRGQAEPLVLGIRNPRRLAEDLPGVIARSRVLSGDGEFVSEENTDDE